MQVHICMHPYCGYCCKPKSEQFKKSLLPRVRRTSQHHFGSFSTTVFPQITIFFFTKFCPTFNLHNSISWVLLEIKIFIEHIKNLSCLTLKAHPNAPLGPVSQLFPPKSTIFTYGFPPKIQLAFNTNQI